MADLPLVVSPLTTVGEREGVTLILVTVEAWSDEVVVRMRGQPSPLTRRMEADFDASLENWAATGGKGHPPDQPGERVFGSDLDVHVTDDLGTAYKLRVGPRRHRHGVPRELDVCSRAT